MTTKIRPRTIAVLAAFLGLLGVVAVTTSSSGAAESSVVRLNLGSDGNYFEHGTTRQDLTVAKNGCQITSAQPVMALSATGTSQSKPGLADGIGVKYSNSSGNGTPCSQTDQLETLVLKPGTSLGGKLFRAVRLDLEMTGNALVKLSFRLGTGAATTYTLQTGTTITATQSSESGYDTTAPYFVSSAPGDEVDACASPNSSGPNSGGNDNCQWTVIPGFDFDTVTLTTTQGTVSLEGGNDFPSGEDMDSLFYLANSAPLAVNDSVTTNEDAAVSGNVTSNDTDPDGDPLTASVVANPSHGSLSLAANGSFTYTPALNYNGPDTFTYNLSDGTATSNTATVSITVTPVNDAPVATGDDAAIDEDTSGTVVVATDVDEGDELTVVCTAPDGWTAEDLGDGEVEITPPADFSGSITIPCTVTDVAGATTSAPVTIDVDVIGFNDAPVAVDDEADFDAAEGNSVDIDVLVNDSDVDGDTLTATNFGYPDGGSATFQDGVVTYTPPTDITAPVTFTYEAFDGDAYSNTATVTVYPLICSDDTVTASDDDVTGSFTRLSDTFACKRFTLLIDLDEQDSILFQPSGVAQSIKYRGVVSFGVDVAPPPGASPLRLNYDPDGGFDFQPMLWCQSPVFDTTNVLENEAGFPLFAAVTSAMLPDDETWCIASAQVWGDENGDLIAYFQTYGEDDPRMSR